MNAIARIALAAAIVTASAAHAAVNPLEPSSYQGHPATVVEGTGDAARYVDSRNPLEPTFYQGKPSARFEATATTVGDAYRDIASPLSPSYVARPAR